jgi:hypothetical protein
MQRKTSTVPTRIYSYGLRAPTKGAVRVHEQLILAGRYYNALIEIERQRRTEYRDARASVAPELVRLDAERDALTVKIEAGREELLAKRQTDRQRTKLPELTLAVQQLKDERRRVILLVKAERERLKGLPELERLSEVVQTRFYERNRAARAASGLYWGTYLLVEKAIESACKSKMDPKFHRVDGTGRLGVQLQGGMTAAELFGSDTRLQFDPVPPDKWDTRPGRRKPSAVRVRIGSDGRAPIWAEFQAVLHRPLPKDAKIGWAWVRVVRNGPHLRWGLQLALESESFRRDPPVKGSERVAAMNLGWRLLESGDVRVGYLVDAFGEKRELVLPGSLRQSLMAASSIRSINDGHFNTARAVLARWMKEHGAIAPAWLSEEIATMHAWHKRGRLSRVARRLAAEMPDFVREAWAAWYREHRVETPRKRRAFHYEDLYAEFDKASAWLSGTPLESITFYLDLWRRKEAHLWEMETGKTGHVARARNNTFAVWASELAKAYATLIIDQTDLAELKRGAPPEGPSDTAAPVSRARDAAGLGYLKGALLAAFGGARLVQAPAHGITRTHDCGHENLSAEFEAERKERIRVTCEGCQVSFDQDEQAAKNLLARFLGEGPGGKPEAAPARGAEKKARSAKIRSRPTATPP